MSTKQLLLTNFFGLAFSHLFFAEHICLTNANAVLTKTVIHIKTIRSQLETEQVLNFLFSHIVFFCAVVVAAAVAASSPSCHFVFICATAPNAISELRNAFLFIFVSHFFPLSLHIFQSLSRCGTYPMSFLEYYSSMYTHFYYKIWLRLYAHAQRFQSIVFIS